MGCKGSKLDDVAAGNTVKNRLLRRKSEAGRSRNRNAIDGSQLQEKSVAENAKGVSDVEGKVDDGASLRGGKEGKGVREEPGSPDEYFSPRKGDHESVGDSLDYQSPRSEGDDGGKRDQERASNVAESKETERVQMKGGEERRSVDGKAALVMEAKLEQNEVSNKESDKLKEDANVVEAANEMAPVENKANHVGEITKEKESVDSPANVDQNISKQLKKDGE